MRGEKNSRIVSRTCKPYAERKPTVQSSEILYEDSLTGLQKLDNRLRRIAVENTLRRIVAKVICKRVRADSIPKLKPHRIGLGVRRGSEAAIHVARLLVLDTSTCQVLVKLNFRNAFNCVFRKKLLHILKCEFPEYSPFIFQCYQNSSLHNFGAINGRRCHSA